MPNEIGGPIELYEWPEGEDVHRNTAVGLLEVPSSGHMPMTGDMLTLSLDGGLVRYRVVGREVVYTESRDDGPILPYLTMWLYVRAAGPAEQPSIS